MVGDHIRVLQGQENLFVVMPNPETRVMGFYTICLLPVKLGISRTLSNAAFQEVWVVICVDVYCFMLLEPGMRMQLHIFNFECFFLIYIVYVRIYWWSS